MKLPVHVAHSSVLQSSLMRRRTSTPFAFRTLQRGQRTPSPIGAMWTFATGMRHAVQLAAPLASFVPQ
jgi:hypothetical protein